MRILVADQNALLLAAITATFGPLCDLVTATRRDVCIAQIEQHQFDVVIACDKLSDYTGLELLSEVSALSPGTLLVFAANSKRLNRLESQLAMFGLYETLAYPITPKKLVDVLKRARECLRAGPFAAEKPVAHVVLDAEWDTGVRLGLVESEIQSRSDAAGRPEHDEWLEGPTREAVAAHSRSLGEDEVDDYVFEASALLLPPAAPVLGERTTIVQGALAEPGMDVTRPQPDEISGAAAPTGFIIDVEPASSSRDANFDVEPLEALPSEAYAAASSEDDLKGAYPPLPPPLPPAKDLASEDSGGEFCTNDPVFEMPEQPQWAEDGAANDMMFVPETAPSAVHRPETSPATSASKAVPATGSTGAARVVPVVSAGKASLVASAAPVARGAIITAGNIAKSEQVSKAAQLSKSSQAKGQSLPRERAQAVPTASQLAAFERARARRNGKVEPTLSVTNWDSPGVAVGTGPAAGIGPEADTKLGAGSINERSSSPLTPPTISTTSFAGPSKSLTDLAKIATNKRPLAQPNVGKSLPSLSLPRKAVFAVSSGLLAVVLLAVLSFEMTRGSNEPEKHMRQAQAGPQPFGTSSNVMAASSPESSDEHFTPAPPEQPPSSQTEGPRPDGPLSEPRAENFDPDSAPANPPPPPILERPGPMEPPSMGSGPPLGMIPGNDSGDPQ